MCKLTHLNEWMPNSACNCTQSCVFLGTPISVQFEGMEGPFIYEPFENCQARLI